MNGFRYLRHNAKLSRTPTGYADPTLQHTRQRSKTLSYQVLLTHKFPESYRYRYYPTFTMTCNQVIIKSLQCLDASKLLSKTTYSYHTMLV